MKLGFKISILIMMNIPLSSYCFEFYSNDENSNKINLGCEVFGNKCGYNVDLAKSFKLAESIWKKKTIYAVTSSGSIKVDYKKITKKCVEEMGGGQRCDLLVDFNVSFKERVLFFVEKKFQIEKVNLLNSVIANDTEVEGNVGIKKSIKKELQTLCLERDYEHYSCQKLLSKINYKNFLKEINKVRFPKDGRLGHDSFEQLFLLPIKVSNKTGTLFFFKKEKLISSFIDDGTLKPLYYFVRNGKTYLIIETGRMIHNVQQFINDRFYILEILPENLEFKTYESIDHRVQTALERVG